MTRVDLHVHTRHTTRAEEWLMRKLDFPASLSNPRAIYRRLREAGMKFVTFTDHNTIAGCLEIADMPGVIIGEEVVTFFPTEEARVHVLVWGHNEAQHREIQDLRENIFDLQAYLAAEKLAHAVAHPFHSPNGKLAASQMIKLALIFRHFESINGRHHHLLGECVVETFGRLKKKHIEEFVERTGIEPTHDEPWKKVFVGGSNDHSGLHLARAWTETPDATTREKFLTFLREGQCEAAGQGGEPITTAHGNYQTAYENIKGKFLSHSNSPAASLIEKAFSRFMEGKDPTVFTLGEKVTFLAQGVATGKIFEMAMAGNTTVWKELSSYFARKDVKSSLARSSREESDPARRTFVMANLIVNNLGFRLFTQFFSHITKGRFIESIQTISLLGPSLVVLSPYLQAFRQTSRIALREASRALLGDVPETLKNRKRAWFTDTFDDVNGVTMTIRTMAGTAVKMGLDVTVITCLAEADRRGIPLENFAPVGEFTVPEYEIQKLSLPPALPILDYIDKGRFTEIIISTPGPLGLLALYIGKTLGLPCTSIYHTDFPQYIGIHTDDAFMETLTWDYMHWFYSQCDTVYVNSEDYRRTWIDRGIPAAKLKILPRGVNSELFSPERRKPSFWQKRGLEEGEVGILYVGRVSKEKNLDTFVAALRKLRRHGARPLIIGDGTYMTEMKRLLPDAIFTGYLSGTELATAYASADIFLFPSTTDTFGNVVIEAQASGLPVIVSDMGGPRELVRHGVDGYITKALDVADIVKVTTPLCEDADLRRALGTAARENILATRNWNSAVKTFWEASQE